MNEHEQAFPTRLIALAPAGGGDGLEGLEAATPKPDPKKINQHIEGDPKRRGVMTAADVKQLLNDPFAKLVLRKGTFPANLIELLAALDAGNGTPDGVPEQSTFLVSEGGQIPFSPGA